LSPARAAPHDATTWLPVPDPGTLPSIDALLRATTEWRGAVAAAADHAGSAGGSNSLEALVTPTPARATPHDPAAWLPLPADLDALPAVDALLEPPPEVTMAVVAEAEALVAGASAAAEAAVAPSPARAEPHDSSTWLPLPDPDSLAPLSALAPADGSADAPGTRTRVGSALRRPRTWALALLTVATVAGVARVAADPAPRAVAGIAPFRVTVDLDGTTTSVVTTARRAPVLARRLDVGKLVAVRSAPPRLREGSSVVLRTRKSGQLKVDGQLVAYDSPSLTVAELLAASNIVLDGEDRTVPSPDTVLVDGTPVEVIRVGAATTQTHEAVPFTEQRVPDATIAVGETREVRAGVPGIDTITWRARVENGVEVGRTVLSRVTTSEPTTRLVGYGTKADWHWDALARCESGGHWNTVDPAGVNGYHGGLGIYYRTWLAWGGDEFAPNAGLATREEQIIVAQRIYADLGWDPWGCARTLGWR
jgi:hypothetical protein